MCKRLFWCSTFGLMALILLFSFATRTARADNPPGGKLFATYCSACHGESGKGGIAPALTTAKFLSAHDDAALTHAIQDGMPDTGMPAWSKSKGGTLNDDQIEAVVAYLRGFAPAAAPTATAPTSASSPTLPPTVNTPTPALSPTPSPTAAPIKTTLTIVQSPGAAGGTVLTAILVQDNGVPVNGAVLAFSRSTTFGVIDLGTVKTDAKGSASLSLVTLPPNARQVIAAFKGDDKLLASETKIALEPPAASLSGNPDPRNISLSVEEPLLAPEGSLITPNPPLLPTAILALVVGGVWATYGYVLYQVFNIWKTGRSIPREHPWSRRGRWRDS